jgi:hypothetical protein
MASSELLAHDRTAGDGWVTRDGVGRRGSPEKLGNEHPTLELDGNNSKTKLRGLRTYLVSWRGGRSGGEGDRRDGALTWAAAALRVSERRGGAGWRGAQARLL